MYLTSGELRIIPLDHKPSVFIEEQKIRLKYIVKDLVKNITYTNH